jgi:hypothetical protein
MREMDDRKLVNLGTRDIPPDEYWDMVQQQGVETATDEEQMIVVGDVQSVVARHGLRRTCVGLYVVLGLLLDRMVISSQLQNQDDQAETEDIIERVRDAMAACVTMEGLLEPIVLDVPKEQAEE